MLIDVQLANTRTDSTSPELCRSVECRPPSTATNFTAASGSTLFLAFSRTRRLHSDPYACLYISFVVLNGLYTSRLTSPTVQTILASDLESISLDELTPVSGRVTTPSMARDRARALRATVPARLRALKVDTVVEIRQRGQKGRDCGMHNSPAIMLGLAADVLIRLIAAIALTGYSGALHATCGIHAVQWRYRRTGWSSPGRIQRFIA